MSKLLDFVACAWALGDGPAAKAAILWRETKNVRVRLGFGRHRPQQTYTLRTICGTLHFRDNFGDITNLSTVIHKQPYRPARPLGDGAILDVGANIGMAAAYFAHLAPGRAVHCFEPLGPNARMIALNCPRAIVNQVAVGAEPGRVQLSVDADSVMASSIETRWQTEPIDVEVIRLDDYVERNAIERIALLKIDTEGMELDVLDGAARTLARTDQVVLETHGAARHEGTLERLRRAGFTILAHASDGTTGEVVAVREAGATPTPATSS